MDNGNRMKRLCDFYIRWVGVIGALYCIVPTLVWFAGTFTLIPFRPVYVLRLVLALAVGSPLAAFVNRVGLSLWVIKHRSPEGPATVLDGALIGAACGIGTVLIPPLTALIASNSLEQAKTFIIICWLVGMAIGICSGGTLAAIGRAHLERSNP
jgi:hypothetical protein